MNTPTLTQATFITAQSGNWSDPNTWLGGIVPPNESSISIAHNVNLDINVVTCGVIIQPNAVLTFDPTKSCTLDNCENIVNLGTISMVPNSSNIIHSILFHDINESKFIGGGMDILDTDPGIWNRGVLNLQGSSKQSWTRLTRSAPKGTKIINVEDSTGWNIGDELAIAPTDSITNSNFYNNWDNCIISSINGNMITVNLPLLYNHVSVADPFNIGVSYPTEVLNLTRNVRIEGRPNGRTHVHNMINTWMDISNVQFRYMGPRQSDGQGYTKDVLGRYAVHFHMCGEATQGTCLSGIVVRDSGSHAFVPHASNGISFLNCISYNTFEDAYWWDTPPVNDSTNPINNSNDIVFDECVAAMTKCDPPFRGYRLAGFTMGSGLRNMICDCVAVGNQGNQGAAGFIWPEPSNYTDNVWNIMGTNISHNNKSDGIFVWENDPHNHIVSNFLIYNNGAYGIEHGAYSNGYKYSNITLIGHKYGVFLYANPISTGTLNPFGYILSFDNIKSTDPLYITAHFITGKAPTFFKNCWFPKVIINELPRHTTNPASGLEDFVNCNLTQSSFNIVGMELGSKVRVQDNGVAYQINDKGTFQTIPKFINI